MKKLITALLILFCLPAVAADRQFDVEMIIFKRHVDPNQVGETWPDRVEPINFNNAGTLQNSNYLAQKGVTLLPNSANQLNDEAAALRNHAGFQVLFHQTWRQGDQNKAYAPKFRIRAGKDYSGQFNTNGSDKSSFTSNTNSFSEETLSGPLYELDGTIQVYVQHYLFLDAQLDLKAPDVREVAIEEKPVVINDMSSDQTVQAGLMQSISPEVKVEKFLKSYRMDQKRRMRSGEIHYLDHPLLGMIIQVRKVEE